MKDLKIVNGKFPDFENESWIEADILIHDGKIEKIGTVTEECAQVIDASGKVVSPGFIDIHAHEDEFKGSREDDFFTGRPRPVDGSHHPDSGKLRRHVQFHGDPCEPDR